MHIKCDNCGKYVSINKFKGLQLTKIPCSTKCFKELCKEKGSKPVDTSKIHAEVNHKPKEFRSQLERDFAGLMAEKKIIVMFEPTILTMEIKKKTRYYLPDFFLPEFGVYIEIKGDVWSQDAYTKYREFSKHIPILLVNPSIMAIIRRN